MAIFRPSSLRSSTPQGCGPFDDLALLLEEVREIKKSQKGMDDKLSRVSRCCDSVALAQQTTSNDLRELSADIKRMLTMTTHVVAHGQSKSRNQSPTREEVLTSASPRRVRVRPPKPIGAIEFKHETSGSSCGGDCLKGRDRRDSFVGPPPEISEKDKRRIASVERRIGWPFGGGPFGPDRQVSACSQCETSMLRDERRPSLASVNVQDDIPMSRAASKELDSSDYKERFEIGEHWPRCIKVRQDLHVANSPVDLKVMKRLLSTSTLKASTTNEEKRWSWRNLVLNPFSRPVLAFTTCVYSVLLYDLYVVPFILFFGVHVEGAWLVLAWIASVFWTLNLVLSFMIPDFNGEDGLIERQPAVAVRYFKRMFPLDLLLLVIDWLNVIMDTHAASGGVDGAAMLGFTPDMLKWMRMSRILKIARIAHMNRLVDHMFFNASDTARFVLFLGKVVFVTLFANHILACLWYWIGGRGYTDTGSRWLDYFDPADDFTGHSFYPYLTSLHWALAQTTLGACDVIPVNSIERAFNIVLLIVGVLNASTIVSLFSALVIQVYMSRQENVKSLQMLRQFLRQHQTPVDLAVKCVVQASHRLSQEKPLHEDQVLDPMLLSASLRLQVLQEIRVPHLLTHPLFRLWGAIDTSAVKKLATQAVTHAFLAVEDNVCIQGNVGSEAYYLIRGKLVYTQEARESYIYAEDMVGSSWGKKTRRTVHPGAWLCEAALWSEWVHVGSVEACEESALIVVCAARLMEVIRETDSISGISSQYGLAFHQRLITSGPPLCQLPSDLGVAFTDVGDLLSQDVAMGLFKGAIGSGEISLEKDEEEYLEKELRSYKCTVQYAPDGTHLERVVSVTAVRVERPAKILGSEAQILYQIGTYEVGRLPKSDCHIPGTKRLSGEAPQAALCRILDNSFKALAADLVWNGCETIVDVKDSTGSVHFRSRIIKTIYKAILQTNLEDLGVPTIRANEYPEKYELESIFPRDLYMLPQDKHTNQYAIYAWLTPAEYSIVDSHDNTPALHDWLYRIFEDCETTALSLITTDAGHFKGDSEMDNLANFSKESPRSPKKMQESPRSPRKLQESPRSPTLRI